MTSPAAVPPIARLNSGVHPRREGAARAVSVDAKLLRAVIEELEFSAEAHENSGDEFCLNRAHDIRTLVRKLDAARKGKS